MEIILIWCYIFNSILKVVYVYLNRFSYSCCFEFRVYYIDRRSRVKRNIFSAIIIMH